MRSGDDRVDRAATPDSTLESLPRKNRSQSFGESPLVDEHTERAGICYSPCVMRDGIVVTPVGNALPNLPKRSPQRSGEPSEQLRDGTSPLHQRRQRTDVGQAFVPPSTVRLAPVM